MTTLCEKYRPECLFDVKGQDEAVYLVKKFLDSFPKEKAMVFNGPAGTGKTSLAHALAKELKHEIIELNASDLRNKEQLDKILKQASQQSSLFNKSKIILVDEVDGVSHEDRGGLDALIELIEQTQFPIILTANNIWDQKLKNIRKYTQIINLKELSFSTITQILKKIAEKENIVLDDEVLKTIALKARGDARAAINDLETVRNINIMSGITEKKPEIHQRDKEVDIFNVLKTILKNPTSNETLNIYDNVNLKLDDIFLWLDENIPLEYHGEELYKAYHALSMADLFRGRIYRQQHWRFLVYQNIFLSAGISSAKMKIKTGFTKYKPPSRILKIWLMNQKQVSKKSIAEKLALFCHIGTKRAIKEFPIFSKIIKNKDIQKKLNLSDREIEFVENY